MRSKIITITSISIILVIWEIVSSSSDTTRFFISSPKLIFEYAWLNGGNILTSTLYTAIEAFSGFLLAGFFSFIAILVCLVFPKLYKMVLPIFVTSQVLPIITLAPLFIILFGMGFLSKIAMVVLMCFFPIFINFSSGINSISQSTHEIMYIYNASKYFRIFHIIIPLSTPYIFTGLRVSTTMAIMGAIVAEFLGAIDGLGKNLYLAPKNSLPELMVCSIFMTAILGWLLFKLIVLIEKKLGKWYLYKNGDNYEYNV